MEVVNKKDGNKNFMIIKGIEIDENDYKFKMLKNNNIENKGNLEDLLKSIYVYKTDIPEWILKRCALENAITLEKVVKKLKLGLKNFMSI